MVKKKKSSKSKKKSEEIEINLTSINKSLKPFLPYIFLFGLLIFGFSLRYYHLPYPVIGYHNWKVAHYITEARNFASEGFFKYGFFVPMRDTISSIDEPISGVHHDTFPTISIVVGFLFKVFGENIEIARLANIFFSLASVIVFYVLVKELFERESLALLAAFLAALNPLYVFFSHNVQVINPGLFFMLLGSYFYILWYKYQVGKKEFSFLYISAFSLMIGAITKYPFAVIFIPIAFVFPYRKILKNIQEYILPGIITAIILSGFPLWLYYSEYYVKHNLYGLGTQQTTLASIGLSKLIDFSVIGDPSFWQIIKSYVADNFTLFGINLFLIGSVLFLLLYLTKNKDNLGYKFMLGYLLSLPLFVLIMGYKLSGHNYHQFPMAPLIIFMIAYFIEIIAQNLSNFVKDNLANKLVYITLVLIIIFVPFSKGKSLFAHSIDSKNRMFNTQFPGLDVAGDYIRTHAAPDDAFFHSSHQSFGVLWHADRQGFKPPNSLEYFQRSEEEANVNWVLVYQGLNPNQPWGLRTYCLFWPECNENQQARGQYLKENYRLVQVGLFPANEQSFPVFLLFRKGGSFNDTKINEMLQTVQPVGKSYFRTDGEYQLIIFNLE